MRWWFLVSSFQSTTLDFFTSEVSSCWWRGHCCSRTGTQRRARETGAFSILLPKEKDRVDIKISAQWTFRKLRLWQVRREQKTGRQVVEFVLRRNKILQGGTKVFLCPPLTWPIRFFFDNFSEDERQVPCCTFVDGDEVQSEEASETTECRQCTDEERRFPRSATSCIIALL